MKIAEGKTITSGPATIYYESYGPTEAPVILMVPGGDETHIHWYQNVPYFVNAGYRVIATNLRGHLLSPCPPWFCHYRYFEQDLAAVLDAEDVATTALVCCSLGGWGGFRLALNRPERVHALVTCGSTLGVEYRAAHGERDSTSSAAMSALLAGRPRPPDFSSARNFLDRYLCMLGSEDGVASAPPALLMSVNRVEDWLQPADIADYNVPTLLVGGDHDTFIGEGFQREVAKVVPGAELSDFMDAGHRPFWEYPDRFNDTVAAWLAEKGWSPG